MTNLIDGDMIQYSVGWSIGDGEVEDAYRRVDEFLKWITEQTGHTESRIFIQGEGNFRKEILPEYKANRRDKAKPTHHEAIREYLIGAWRAEVVDGEEVDDKLGYTQGDGTIICSGDKDLDCIPGKHFNWSKKYVDKGIYELSEVESNRFFYTQCLTGDSTDNINGLKKSVGKVATKKIKEPLLTMESNIDMYNYVSSIYGDYNFHPQAKCLWIRRKENEIWEPPKMVEDVRQDMGMQDKGIKQENTGLGMG